MAARRWTLVVVCVATTMLVLDIAVVNTALRPIAASLHTTLGPLKWVVDAYALALSAVVLSAGVLADRLGRRKLFYAGLVSFTVASAGCAGARSIEALDAARAVQGFGAAAMFAVSLALLAHAYPDVSDRRKALAVYGATIGGAFAVGPLVGGALASGFGWRWIFLVNIPLGVVCLLATRYAVKESRDARAGGLDVRGQVLLAGGLFALVFAMLRVNELGWCTLIIVALAGAAACLVGFVLNERRARHPILPLSLFRRRDFTAAQLTAFGISASVFAGYLYMTIYLQAVAGLSPIETGLAYLPGTFVSFLVAGATAALGARVSPRGLIASGLVLAAIGLALMTATLGVGSSVWAFEPGLVVSMIGVGLINPVLSGLALNSVDDADSGLAAGANDTFRQAGIAVGVAGLGALLPAHPTSAVTFVAGLHQALLVAVALTALSALAVSILLGQRGMRRTVVVLPWAPGAVDEVIRWSSVGSAQPRLTEAGPAARPMLQQIRLRVIDGEPDSRSGDRAADPDLIKCSAQLASPWPRQVARHFGATSRESGEEQPPVRQQWDEQQSARRSRSDSAG